tara:strand:+ start:5654 stop:6685 length:1032 start_codon:yes stop_codon:yes gene_type:complete
MIVPGDIDRLLLIAPTWIGDTIMASGFFRAARTACPSAEITLAASPNLMPIVEGSPWFDRIESFQPSGMLGPVSTGRRLGRTRPDATVLLPGSFRSALTAWWTRAPIRIGTRRDGRRSLLTHAIPDADRSRPVPAVEHYMRIAHAAFGEGHTDTSLALTITPHDEKTASSAIGLDASTPLLLLVPGANREDKRWPAERFAVVADTLFREHGLVPIVAGAPSESELTRSIVDAMRDAPGVDGPSVGLDLHGLKAVAGRAKLAVSNDTGPRHIAAAAGTPVVSLFGPTDHRWTILPGCLERRLLAEPFLPEDTMADQAPNLCHIGRITVEDVLEASRALLAARTD